jgi:hypothetical protein
MRTEQNGIGTEMVPSHLCTASSSVLKWHAITTRGLFDGSIDIQMQQVKARTRRNYAAGASCAVTKDPAYLLQAQGSALSPELSCMLTTPSLATGFR